MPVRIAYTVITVVLFIFAGAVGYFAVSQFLAVVQVTGRSLANSVGGVDDFYVEADQFTTMLISSVLAVAIFGLAIWVYNYSQAKALQGGGL